MDITALRPKKRSAFRLYVGKKYYTSKRYVQWILARKRYAKKKQTALLPHSYFTHKTMLLRELKDVDMKLQYNKIVNLKIAVSKINQIVLEPGETFSYWRTIGRPTYKKGYVDGMVLFAGSYRTGVGGGLCQLSNLIYWMTLHTPLTVVERHRHSYDVFPDSNRTQPFGSGATCSYNYLDLQIKNETDTPFQLCLKVTDSHLIGEWRGASPSLYNYDVYEKAHQITPAYFGGYIRHNQIYRKKYNRRGVLLEEEYITENHALMMYEPLLTSDEENTS